MKTNFKSLIMSFAGLLLFVLVPVTLFAQTNFTGTWALNESKSNFGDSRFRMAATSVVVTQDAKVLNVETTQPGPGGDEMKRTAKYNLDGSVSENPMFGDNVSKSTATWSEDKAVMTIATTMTFDMGGESRTMNSSQIWKLTEGGKVLMIENVRTGRDGNEVKTTAAYDKK
ncbi:MAG TPA: hypothetical protein PLB43_11550 [Prolixibacteraceae bacterium]|jgi:hypothetical protein|nr:hypothetical protein [Prolixibacteraceae bacterium]HOS01275.1 hypothetical protein [Prolixibacteraceae bacterium]HPL46365.1 hypothetical protein [Prolixibacteraceae bacterium]HQJ85391.1 hypothetical protein [Prolixibacteraceae bacterium]